MTASARLHDSLAVIKKHFKLVGIFVIRTEMPWTVTVGPAPARRDDPAPGPSESETGPRRAGRNHSNPAVTLAGDRVLSDSESHGRTRRLRDLKVARLGLGDSRVIPRLARSRRLGPPNRLVRSGPGHARSGSVRVARQRLACLAAASRMTQVRVNGTVTVPLGLGVVSCSESSSKLA